MSGKPIPDEVVAHVCDRMLTAAIGKDWRNRATEAVTAFWMGEVREALQEVVPALTAAQQQGQAVADDMGGFSSDTAALAFLHIIGNGNPNVERAVERLRQSLIAQQPAPCAAVGADAPGSRAWMAEVCRAAALSLAAHGVRNDQLSKVADWIAQQPAGVDEAYPTPRNRAEAAALARLALAHLGVIDAHIDAAIARCETNSAAQHQEPKP